MSRAGQMFTAAGVAFVIGLGLASSAHAQAQKAAGSQPAATSPAAAPAQPPPPPFPNLMTLVEKSRDAERKIAQEREAQFRAALQRQQDAAKSAVARRNAAEARSSQLDKAYADNEQKIAEISELLKQQSGNLGELFGVTRQVAGDAATVLQDSLLTVQYKQETGEERSDFLRRMAAAKALPSLPELERLWSELLRELVDTGKVAEFTTSVLQTDGSLRDGVRVVRIGPFNAVADGIFLGYLPSKKSLTMLDGELPAGYRSIARSLQGAVGQAGIVPAVVDPARGSIIGLFLDRPNLFERIQRGEAVGYLIIAVGLLGLVLAAAQAIHLAITNQKVKSQLRNISKPSPENPLGRVLLAVRGDKSSDQSPEVVELRISEAVLRELPALERFQSFLKLAVSAGPLLGLIGTVIGMIITFKVIVASGSSDPKMMATGIGQAMIATVLGLGIAIPLLFINSGLSTMSRRIIQILDEESQALLASNIRQTKPGS